jgi:two-component system sensor histidine kinase HydH
MKITALPIRYLLLAAFLLVGLLPIVFMSSLALYEAKSALTKEIINDMQTRVSATASEIDRMMFERLQNVTSWRELEVMQDARILDVDKRLSHFLAELKSSYRDVYHDLYVVMPNSMIIAASDATTIGQPYVEAPQWFSVQMPQSHVSILKLRGKTLTIKAPILDALNQEIVAYLMVEFNWQQVMNIIHRDVTGKSDAALFDAQQKIVASSAHWKTGENAQLITVQASTDHYLNLGWRLKMQQHPTEMLAPVAKMTNIFIGLFLASIVLATMVGIPVARFITSPIAKLTHFAQAFIRSPSVVSPPIGGPAEVQTMSKAFAKMLADLEQSKTALTRAAKLAVAGEMAAAMSHEIRTPLGILRSSAQILKREPQLSTEGKEVCGFIIHETERLNRLVSTLIDTAKPRLPIFVNTNLTLLTEQSLKMLASQASKKNIQMHLQHQPLDTTAVIVNCDAEQMTQVLLNLLMNAVQILPNNGQIWITLKQMTDDVILSIVDNGKGIPEEALSQVFEPFFSQREGGVGLGLAVVRQIVEAHQGTITVKNAIIDGRHQGAEFIIQLPNLKKALA